MDGRADGDGLSGPVDLNPHELRRFGLGLMERGARHYKPVVLIYCLECGTQIALERRQADPDRWWWCIRECNTRPLFDSLSDTA